jgi:hypothetical protein
VLVAGIGAAIKKIFDWFFRKEENTEAKPTGE